MLKQLLRTATIGASFLAMQSCWAATDITFYYPIAVGGPITKILDGYVAEFEKANPDIVVKPVYTGSYQDTTAKALTAAKAGTPPTIAVLLSTDMFTMIDNDLVVPFDDLAKTAEQKALLQAFYPAFMANSMTGGKTWGIPFQRSTVVQYWNKDAFKAAGLDPDKAPASWDELVSMGQKLTLKDASGKVTQWGVQIPSSGFPYWLFQSLATEAGATLASPDGKKTFFDDPKVVEAAQFFRDLSVKDKVMPEGITQWGTTPEDFFQKKIAMMWTTTGNLTNVKAHAGFNFGVAPLPAKMRGGSPTGGGNLYIFKKATPEQQEAAFKFVQFLTTPERAADWGIATGYVATRPDAWETPKMKAYVASFPAAAVARDQLKDSVAELSTHDNERVTQGLNDALQAVLTGAKPADVALKQAQANAVRLLKSYQ
ncbi:MAG: ABC transporter substrate-binding protein [Hyphomicrobiales bacterium]|nr:ABC transporter substrate-binding protein [Hyphomicrobiales bacterium]MDE2116197.1 ABC transporter substrate-binding protein [Hyphomicrobiales bacterium]